MARRDIIAETAKILIRAYQDRASEVAVWRYEEFLNEGESDEAEAMDMVLFEIFSINNS